MGILSHLCKVNQALVCSLHVSAQEKIWGNKKFQEHEGSCLQGRGVGAQREGFYWLTYLLKALLPFHSLLLRPLPFLHLHWALCLGQELFRSWSYWKSSLILVTIFLYHICGTRSFWMQTWSQRVFSPNAIFHVAWCVWEYFQPLFVEIQKLKVYLIAKGHLGIAVWELHVLPFGEKEEKQTKKAQTNQTKNIPKHNKTPPSHSKVV